MGDINTNIRIDELETQLNKKASADAFGMVKIGDGISVNDGVISVTGGGGGVGITIIDTPDWSEWDGETGAMTPANLSALNAALTAGTAFTLKIPDGSDYYMNYNGAFVGGGGSVHDKY